MNALASMAPMNRRDKLLAALVACIWGFNFVVIDWGLRDFPPLLFLALRFVFVLFPAIFLVPRPDVPWQTLLAVGTFTSLGQFGLLYVGLAAGMPPGLAGLVLQSQVVFTLIIATAVLNERPNRSQQLGVALGVIGLLVVGMGRGGHIPLLALLLTVGGALSWALGNVITRAAGVRSGLGLVVWSALVVPLPLLLLSGLVDGPAATARALASIDARVLLSSLYTAVLASLLGYGIFNSLLARNPPAAVVPWAMLVPPVSMGSAWWLLGEVPNAPELIGGATLVLGVLVAQTGDVAVLRRRPRGEAATVASSAGFRPPVTPSAADSPPAPGRRSPPPAPAR